MSVAYLVNGEWVDANGKPAAAPAEVAPEVADIAPVEVTPGAAETEPEKPKRKRG
jgi:hypothetical protein